MTPPLDPVTFEVLRHRLWEINDEMGGMAARISGAPTVYETNDFNCAILDAKGRGLFTGVYVIRQASALDVVVQCILERFGDDVHDGDMFMTNDPWCGALHAMDYAVAAPVFWEGKLVAWTGVVMHEMDVGGPRPGSWSIGARDAYQECPLMPPFKIVEAGKFRKELEAIYLRNSRTPDINGLNLRAKIAAQNSARERIRDVIRECGIDTFLALQTQIMDYVRAAVRKRISLIPDGTWYGNTVLDHNGTDYLNYRLKLALTKKGDHLTFDFTGTAKQAPGPVNCTYSGLVGGVTQVVFPLLCFDVPWSHGAIVDCFDIISEPGTIINATFPAATSMATTNGSASIGNLIWEAMGRMYSCCPELRDEVIAPGFNGQNLGIFNGFRPDGRKFLNLFTDPTGGAGAKVDRDGVHSSAALNNPGYAIPNVERIENLAPVLYIYRKEQPLSAGAGKFRGGLSLEHMIIPHGMTDDMDAIFFNMGSNHLIPKGLGGGLPGSMQQNILLRNATVREDLGRSQMPTKMSEATYERLDLQDAKTVTRMSPQDVWVNFCCGGGGYGDPLLREPQRVVEDVHVGYCVPEFARDLYGVVLNADGSADLDATVARRKAMRADRLKVARPLGEPWQVDFNGPEIFVYADSLAVRRTTSGLGYGCVCCGKSIAPASEDPRGRTVMIERQVSELTPLNAFRAASVVLREYCCPSCGIILSADVQMPDEDPRMPEVRLDPAWLEARAQFLKAAMQ